MISVFFFFFFLGGGGALFGFSSLYRWDLVSHPSLALQTSCCYFCFLHGGDNVPSPGAVANENKLFDV